MRHSAPTASKSGSQKRSAARAWTGPSYKLCWTICGKVIRVYIHDFSRLARSTKDLLEIVERLQSKGVHLVSNKENLDTGTPTGKLMLTMIAAINEFERQNLLDRQRERIAIAKRNGVYKGRKKVAMPDNFPALYDRYTRRELNKGQLAEALHVTRPTLERMIREHLSNQKT